MLSLIPHVQKHRNRYDRIRLAGYYVPTCESKMISQLKCIYTVRNFTSFRHSENYTLKDRYYGCTSMFFDKS